VLARHRTVEAGAGAAETQEVVLWCVVDRDLPSSLPFSPSLPSSPRPSSLRPLSLPHSLTRSLPRCLPPCLLPSLPFREQARAAANAAATLPSRPRVPPEVVELLQRKVFAAAKETAFAQVRV
jgi:hypothetical protein